MAFTIKTTMAFSGQTQGWSESFYWSSPDGNLATAETLVTPLIQKRSRLLASGYQIDLARNVVVLNGTTKVLRQSDLFGNGGAVVWPGVGTWAPATPNLALLCYWQNATNQFNKRQYMRGIPAGLGDLGKIPDLNSPTALSFGSNFAAWTSACANFNNGAGIGWLASAVAQTAVIDSYTVDPVTAQVTFALATPGFAPWPVATGNPTRVYCKLPGKNPLDGPLVVIPTSATSCFTPGSHPAAPLPTGQLGIMTLRTGSLVTLAPAVPGGPSGSIAALRIISHKTGRPTYASRGRASKKVLW